MPNVFEPRLAFKPFEYPQIIPFKHAIRQAMWTESEWNFVSDIQDYHVNLNDVERSAIKNSLLAISQIEVAVKKFWGRLGDRFPKPEFEQVGATFAESEVRHSDAYSHLLEILGLNQEFDLLLQNPIIQGRVDYLQKYLKGASANSDENYTLTLTLFSLFVENVSLFSQFLIVKAFNKERNMLKDIDNVIQATAKEETIHALFGSEVIKIIKAENPEWFDDTFWAKLVRACKKAYTAEAAIVDWIFESGELPFLSKETVKEFIKERFNESIAMLGGPPVFEINRTLTKKVDWFKDELLLQTNVDFFNKKSTDYSKGVQTITADDLF